MGVLFNNWQELVAYLLHLVEVMTKSDRLVRLSPSMMARETHRIHPVAPVFQSIISPGAHPFARAYGPRMPYPAC